MEDFELNSQSLGKTNLIKFIQESEDLNIVECIYSMLRRVPKSYREGNNIGWILNLNPLQISSIIDLERAYLDKETWDSDYESVIK